MDWLCASWRSRFFRPAAETAREAPAVSASGIPLLQGRIFAGGDTGDSQNVAIIDRYLAHKYISKGDAIGARIVRGLPDPKDVMKSTCTIVGDVGSVKTSDMAERNPIGQIYFAARQYPARYTYLVVSSRQRRYWWNSAPLRPALSRLPG